MFSVITLRGIKNKIVLKYKRFFLLAMENCGSLILDVPQFFENDQKIFAALCRFVGIFTYDSFTFSWFQS